MLYCILYISIHRYPVYGVTYKQPCLSQFPCGCCVAGSISASAIEKVLLSICILWPCHLSWPTLLCGQPCMIYTLSSCRCASCISCIDVHTGRPTVVLIVLTFILRPHIYLSSFCGCSMITNLQ